MKFSSHSIALVAYDKRYQIRHENLAIPNELIPKGILRVELQCGRAWILEYAKSRNLKHTDDILQALSGDSREMICKYAGKLYRGGQHCKGERLEKLLKEDSRISKRVRKRMLALSHQLGSAKHAEKALSKLHFTNKQLRTCLSHFDRLAINPIPLDGDYLVNQMDSLLMLLRTADTDGSNLQYAKKGRIK